MSQDGTGGGARRPPPPKRSRPDDLASAQAEVVRLRGKVRDAVDELRKRTSERNHLLGQVTAANDRAVTSEQAVIRNVRERNAAQEALRPFAECAAQMGPYVGETQVWLTIEHPRGGVRALLHVVNFRTAEEASA